MEIGIFAKTFQRPTLDAVLDAVAEHGLRAVQFNMSCTGLESMPEAIEPELRQRIRDETGRRGIGIAALSGTFNMIHPDHEKRQAGLRRLGVLTEAAADIGTSVITLSTGTRDPENMWRSHPENSSPEAWRELLESMASAVEIAAEEDVTLAFEPEVSNVVDSAIKGRRLLDEVRSPHLKVVIDPANLFHAGELPHMRQILKEAFDLLGSDVVIAHAKDLSRDGEAGQDAAGTGVLDYDAYLSLLDACGFDGPWILHGLDESQVDRAVAFLRNKLEESERHRRS